MYNLEAQLQVPSVDLFLNSNIENIYIRVQRCIKLFGLKLMVFCRNLKIAKLFMILPVFGVLVCVALQCSRKSF